MTAHRAHAFCRTCRRPIEYCDGSQHVERDRCDRNNPGWWHQIDTWTRIIPNHAAKPIVLEGRALILSEHAYSETDVYGEPAYGACSCGEDYGVDYGASPLLHAEHLDAELKKAGWTV